MPELEPDEEIEEFLKQHSSHKFVFIRADGKTKLKCSTCDKIIGVRVIARSRIEMDIPKIDRKYLKSLLDQIGSHSGKICTLIVELKEYPSTEHGVQLKEEIAVQNECIQDILVSFHNLFLSEKV